MYGKYSSREKQNLELKGNLNHEKYLQNYDLSPFCQLTSIRNTFPSVVVLRTAVFRENAVVSLVVTCLFLRLKHSGVRSGEHAEVFSIPFPPFSGSFPGLSCYF